MREEGYYWIKLSNGHWFIGEYLAMDWYVCGLRAPLSKEPIEIDEKRIIK